jgi:hypothetical protein
MDAMIHDDEQGIAYKRHLERINISYLLVYKFPSRYNCKPIKPNLTLAWGFIKLTTLLMTFVKHMK